MKDDASIDNVYRGEHYDETSGKKFDSVAVERARPEDIAYFNEMKVYEKVPYNRRARERNPVENEWEAQEQACRQRVQSWRRSGDVCAHPSAGG